ncbi:type II toxin-antitoxin system VapC family toxin [Candidatus Woesearchaeota archaeon]|nr:type II toxin-antitoxin system VapC family toxin [Candidatus Woesearchaeota archaeon]
MILDTSFIIDFLHGKTEAVTLYQRIEETTATTSISVFEIFKGIKNSKELEQVADFMEDIMVHDFNKKAAEIAGLAWKTLRESGQEIEPEDCMIAAIALAANEVLVTRNADHFRRIIGLKVVTY